MIHYTVQFNVNSNYILSWIIFNNFYISCCYFYSINLTKTMELNNLTQANILNLIQI